VSAASVGSEAARPAPDTSPRERDALALEGVRKAYGAVEVVRGLDITVHRGELLTLLGPSGSGKTTLLMIAAGFVTPDHGRVLLDDRDITGMPPQHRNIGVVFQHYALFPHRTVAENIAFPLRMRHVSRTEQQRRVEEALDLVRLQGYGARYPRELSGGQQQRVALARALVFNPPLLLLDEPLGALDKNLRKDMQLELRQLQGRLALTMVYVTHDQEEALTLSDRVVVIRDGRVEQCADPQEIYTRPRNRFVATFIGEMNVLPGVLRSTAPFIFETDGGLLVPVEPTAWTPGTQCALGVRPEHIGLRVAGAANGDHVDPAAPRVPATVASVAYLGEAWLYELTLRGGATLRAKRPAQGGAARFTPGTPVEASWRAPDAMLLEG
jgi:putative spermidine/putrescine transport system ATP-binding protein